MPTTDTSGPTPRKLKSTRVTVDFAKDRTLLAEIEERAAAFERPVAWTIRRLLREKFADDQQTPRAADVARDRERRSPRPRK